MKLRSYLSLASILALLGGCGTAAVRSGAGASAKDWTGQQQAFSALAESSVTETGVQVRLRNLFNVGRSKLSKDGLQKVDDLAALLLKYPKDHVTVLVYTDNSGKPARNLRVTQRRADAVKAELVKQGVPDSSLRAIGKGEQDPLVPNDTAQDQAKNRRVELDIASM